MNESFNARKEIIILLDWLIETNKITKEEYDKVLNRLSNASLIQGTAKDIITIFDKR